MKDQVCSINFEPPDSNLCSAYHVYPISRGAWIISVLFIALGSLRSGKLYWIMASLIEEEIIIPLTNSFEALLDTTEEFLQDHTGESEKDLIHRINLVKLATWA